MSELINQLLNGLYNLFSRLENHVLKGVLFKKRMYSHGATFKGKNMLPIGSIFFSLRVAAMGIENNFKGH